jgi:hypothetical protein
MYQQWMQGNAEYARDWMIFIEFASKHVNASQADILTALQKTYWFEWQREE